MGMDTGTASAYCPGCGTLAAPDARFCTVCGQRMGVVDPAAAAQEDPLLARVRHALLHEYDVAREIGRGGMAVVFLAQDLRLPRKVALKVMLPELAYSGAMPQRFVAEARTAAMLDHPNIVPIFRAGDSEGLRYFAMRYIDGCSLEQLLREGGALPIPVACHVLAEVALALEYAHQQGVVHRDVKPSNVMLDRRWARPIVTDFGIARVADGQRLTSTGLAIGTPEYMSPEQYTGRELTGASDQYALGAVAFQLLTGRPPFVGTAVEMLVAHVQQPAPSLRAIRPEIPPALEALVLRMLAKDPAARWATLGEIVPHLQQHVGTSQTAMQEQLVGLVPAQALRDGPPVTPVSPVPESGFGTLPAAPAPAVAPPVAPPAAPSIPGPVAGPSVAPPVVAPSVVAPPVAGPALASGGAAALGATSPVGGGTEVDGDRVQTVRGSIPRAPVAPEAVAPPAIGVTVYTPQGAVPPDAPGPVAPPIGDDDPEHTNVRPAVGFVGEGVTPVTVPEAPPAPRPSRGPLYAVGGLAAVALAMFVVFGREGESEPPPPVVEQAVAPPPPAPAPPPPAAPAPDTAADSAATDSAATAAADSLRLAQADSAARADSLVKASARTVTIEPRSAERRQLVVGDRSELTVILLNGFGRKAPPGGTIAWRSSNPGAVEVIPIGNGSVAAVRGRAPADSVVVTASIGRASRAAIFRVMPPGGPPEPRSTALPAISSSVAIALTDGLAGRIRTRQVDALRSLFGADGAAFLDFVGRTELTGTDYSAGELNDAGGRSSLPIEVTVAWKERRAMAKDRIRRATASLVVSFRREGATWGIERVTLAQPFRP